MDYFFQPNSKQIAGNAKATIAEAMQRALSDRQSSFHLP
jgi:hypothetical protein